MAEYVVDLDLYLGILGFLLVSYVGRTFCLRKGYLYLLDLVSCNNG